MSICFSFVATKNRHEKSLDEAFRSVEKPEGLAIIVAHSGVKDELKGVHVDYDLAKNTFEKLKFATLCLKNEPTVSVGAAVKVVGMYDAFPKSLKHVVFVYSGHGGDDTITDGNEPLLISKHIVAPLCSLNNIISMELKHIPKLFFFDCCRGDSKDPGISLKGKPSDETSQPIKLDVVPTCGNYFIAYSTMRTMAAMDGINKNSATGSTWINVLMKALTESRETIANILVNVTWGVINEMGKKREAFKHIQQTVVISTLRQHVYLK